jgi:HK97 family phage major capsid protein
MYTLDTLPAWVSSYAEPERAEWLRVFNQVYAQTQDETKSCAAADGAVTKMRMMGLRALKTADNGDLIIGGWAMKFSDRNDKDLHDTYFATASKLMLEYYPGAPLWYEHGQDNAYGIDPIGKREAVEIYGHGIWMEHRLYATHRLFAQTKREVEAGEHSYSSDSIGHYVERGFNPVDGRLDAWPFAGCSITRSPAEVSLGPVTVQTFAAALRSATEHQQPNGEAREAQTDGVQPDSIEIKTQGANTMDPQKLAALAEFLGCEATPEAVATALQELVGQLQAAPAEGENMEAAAIMSSLRSTFGLAEDAAADDVIARLESIQAELEPMAEGQLNVAALKRFVDMSGDEPIADELPAYRSDTPRTAKGGAAKRVNFNRGVARPGLIELLQAINPQSQRSNRAAKAQSYQLGPTGGYILNHEVAADMLPALRDQLPLVGMGVTTYDMDGVESLTIPKDKTENTAYWVGEDTEVPESNETVGGVTLFPRPLAARVIVPNKYLQNAIPNYEARVREKVAYAISRAIMNAALFGTGGKSGSNTGSQPTGLDVLGQISTRAVTRTSLGTNGAKPKLADITAAFGRIEDSNVEIDETAALLFAPRTKRFFQDLTDTNGQPLIRTDWRSTGDQDIAGYNWETSNLIPITDTQGTSSDCSKIFAGVWKHMAIGQSNQFEFLVDPYSRSSYLQTVIIASTYVDIAVLYDEAFEVLIGVKP